MARLGFSLCLVLALATLSVAELPAAQYPATQLPAAKYPAAKLPAPHDPAEEVVPGAKGVAGKELPAKKVGAKWVRPPLGLACKVTPAQLPQVTVNCKVANLLQVPVCVSVNCNPLPPGICGPGTGGNGGQISGPPPDCAWNVINGCKSPQPVYPGQAWVFGWTTSLGKPIVTLPPGRASYFVANDTQCPA